MVMAAILWEDGTEILWEDGTAILWEEVDDGGEGEPGGGGGEGEFPAFIDENGVVFVNEDGTTPFVDEVAVPAGLPLGPMPVYRTKMEFDCYFYRLWGE